MNKPRAKETVWSTIAGRFILGCCLGLVVWITHGSFRGGSWPWLGVVYFTIGLGVLAVLLGAWFWKLVRPWHAKNRWKW